MNESKVFTKKRGAEVLTTPLINKGTAFTLKERDQLELHGLLPAHVSTLEEQIERSYANFEQRRTPLGKYIYLLSLLNRNEVLFYSLLSKYAAQMLPYLYTPTVGEAAVEYSRIYSHRRGLYVSYPLRDQMEAMLDNVANSEVEVLVVTDGERILGLGDQGIGGMSISVGKLCLYTLFGGIHPSRTLPVLLDVGTNNKAHLENKLYLGWSHPRITGTEYDRFIDAFVKAVYRKFPKALLQWEDFGRENARRLLDQYRQQHLSFNDDIQGTAAVTLAALLAAVKVNRQSLKEQRIVIFGGGSAGTGIADILLSSMIDHGLSKEEALRKIFLIDVNGLIHFNSSGVYESQKAYVKTREELASWKVRNFEHIPLQEVVANAHPTILVGVSAQGGAFTREVIEEMGRHTKRPIVFPLSNPTSKSEATPQELLEWTEGRAIVATGSPFQPVQYKGETFTLSQCNNVFIFPGVGLGALASEATQVTEGMFLAAAEELAERSPATRSASHSLFPPIEEVRELSRHIALAVGKRAIHEGVSTLASSELKKRIEGRMWEPRYPTLMPE
jgi:malate dehydrogenase (oxaloacetate-decarboxylating)